MGYALAEAAWRRGAEVRLISGSSALEPPTGPEVLRVETAEQMCAAVAAALPAADVLIMAAAVADFRAETSAPSKLKKQTGVVPEIRLAPTPDVLRETRHLRAPGAIVVGFALETDDPVENGWRKLRGKELDLRVVNDATEPGAGFEVATNRVTLLHRGGAAVELPLLTKHEVAERILDRVVPLLGRASPAP